MPSPHTVFAQTAAATHAQFQTQTTATAPAPAPATTAGATAAANPIPGPETAFALGRGVTGVSAHASANASAATPSNLRTAPARGYHHSQANSQSQSQSQSSYRAAQPPRTSSLLPPPNLIFSGSHPQQSNQQQQHPVLFQNPFNAHRPIVAPPVIDPGETPTHWPPRRSSSQWTTSQSPSQSKRRPSRSSSAGGLSDSFRNLNRWSASTASSRASLSHARGQSIDAVAIQSQLHAQSPAQDTLAGSSLYNSPPRKLQKNRPSVSSTPGARIRRLSPSPAPVPPLESLPPIIALPSLEHEVASGATDVAAAATAAGVRNDSVANESLRSRNDSVVTTLDQFIATSSPAVPESRFAAPHGRSMSDISTMFERNGDSSHAKGHSRNRSQAAKGSTDTNASTRSRDRSSKGPSQKIMLSRALQKANAAVQLDHARNFEGARQSYSEACELLQQVLQRTNGDDDRKKLEAISKTYIIRIEELDDILPEQSQRGKALPSRPNNADHDDVLIYDPADGSDEEPVVQTATATLVFSDQDREPGQQSGVTYYAPSYGVQNQTAATAMPRTAASNTRYGASPTPTSQYSLQSAFSSHPQRQDSRNVNELTIQRPMESQYIPPPLSPRRPISPGKPPGRTSPDAAVRADFSMPNPVAQPDRLYTPDNASYSRGHRRGTSHESVSWLDPIDESGGSNPSSVHSRSSSMGLRRRHIRGPSGDETGAEFDAALDDAIEAAYDDGYDVVSTTETRQYSDDSDDVVARAMKRVQIAKERVRETEREAMELANEREKRLREQLMMEDEAEPEDFYDGNDSEEEERMLDELTKDYGTGDFAFGLKSHAQHMPRASDSSENTSRTWHTSTGSNPPTATTAHTTLTTVSEGSILSGIANVKNPLPPPPTQALPELPPQRPGSSGRPPSSSGSQGGPLFNGQGVRSRRLSGQNATQLKIETYQPRQPDSHVMRPPATAGAVQPYMAPAPSQSPQPKTAGFIVQQRQAAAAGRTGPLKMAPSPLLPSEPLPPTPPLPQGIIMQELDGRSASPGAPLTKPPLRKNFSSSSLKTMKTRNLSVSILDDASDLSPGTPLSNQFGPPSRAPAMPSLPTPITAAFKDRINSGSTGGMHLFDNDFHSMDSPGLPNPMTVDGPVPLEACPTDQMLRPFWLMRCLYQTLANPRGGYISNKLFVPRDVWKVKGVKLKNTEDKVANLDFLTAALQKLARVDTCDADALLEEMQSLEGALEQVQATLSRKLGNDVGIQSASTMFKDAGSTPLLNGDGADSGAFSGSSAVPRSGSISGKSSSFSWRRLRPKNSSAGLGSNYSAPNGLGGGRKDSSANLIEGALLGSKPEGLVSLPMTEHPTSRPSKRDLSHVTFNGPNATYMASLARLFDAAQVIDQIARQVEDPGLRHADKTQVGLELCTRHAAEFFAFYVCRFVLQDLTMLLDKFVKRGSEWVLV